MFIIRFYIYYIKNKLNKYISYIVQIFAIFLILGITFIFEFRRSHNSNRLGNTGQVVNNSLKDPFLHMPRFERLLVALNIVLLNEILQSTKTIVLKWVIISEVNKKTRKGQVILRGLWMSIYDSSDSLQPC